MTVHCAAAEPREVTTISLAERIYVANHASPPTHLQAGWEPVRLKDVWGNQRRARHQEAWYRATFMQSGDSGPLALFVPRISANASFWINGYEAGNTGSFADPLPRNWNHPVYLPIAREWLREGSNELHVRLKVDQSRLGLLFEIDIGPRDLLYPRYALSHFAKVTASQILTVLMLVGVLIVLVFYFTAGLPRTYLWFALGSFCWALYSLELFVRRVPMPTEAWAMFYSTMLFVAMYFYSRTIHGVLHLNRRWVERAVLAVSVVNVAMTAIPQSRQPFDLRPLIQSLFLVFPVYAGLTLSMPAMRRKLPNRGWILFCGITILLLVGYDLVLAGLRITAEFAKFPYLPLAAFVAGGSVFIHRLIDIAQDRDRLSSDLVATRAHEQLAISEERARLMREIHDGVGSQLVSTLARLERNPQADQNLVRSLRTSLDELRLIVHSLQTMSQQGDIATILATIRERIEPGLNAQGIEFDWQVRPLPAIDWFEPEQALNLMRLVQEAITNVIKHAHASQVRIACGEVEHGGRAGVFIEISDNGIGFRPNDHPVGVGLASIRHRAERLDGELTVTSSTDGTRVMLWLPVRPGTSAIADLQTGAAAPPP